MAKLGIQLYTVKDETAKDFFGTIRRVAQMGYDGVEFAGYFGAKAGELKQLLAELGLEAAGTVAPMEEWERGADGVVQYALELGCPAIVFPYIAGHLRENAAGYVKVAQRLNGFAGICRSAGLRFLYHIHGYEFTPTDNGQTGMELLLAHCDPERVQLEVDVYWTEHGGADSVEFLRRHGARSPYIHLKDMKDRESCTDTEVGDGVIDIAGVIAEGLRHGAEWLIVEQEQFDRPTLESAAISQRNVSRMMRQIQSGGTGGRANA